ncbi:unnamed protein product [Peronospora belbahrii]|uniref:PH domain-containing protein n=1 Tax=Peronospora belbahrii TaxID=622444 RepID=A0ABN8CXL3_9STRA|nr:unnamed protein product [Peronospora belbahrii]
MKMRTCGLFWYKAIVSLTFITWQRPDPGLLTIFRPKAFGGRLEIRLRHEASSLISVSGKELRHRQIRIRYGRWCQSVTLRAPTSAVFETWWAALENAFALPNFVTVPIVDARVHQMTIAPVVPARHNAARSKQLLALEIDVEVEPETISIDNMPMLEAKGPSSPADIDVLASWRTWNSQDYFATPTSSSTPIHTYPGTNDDHVSNDCNRSEQNSLYSDISEFWSRPSEWEYKELHDNPVVSYNTYDSFIAEIPHDSTSQDDDAWLDAIAFYIFRQKAVATQLLDRHPSDRVTPCRDVG